MANNSALTRYRPALLVLAALAAGYSIYYVHSSRQVSTQPRKTQRRLRRSNAVVHRQRNIQSRSDVPRDPSEFPSSTWEAQRLLEEYGACPDPIGTYKRDLSEYLGRRALFVVPLSTVAFPSFDVIREDCSVSLEEAENIRQDYEEQLMKTFICQRVPPNCTIIDHGGPEAFIAAFQDEEFHFAQSLIGPITIYNYGGYDHIPERRSAYTSRGLRPPARQLLHRSPIEDPTASIIAHDHTQSGIQRAEENPEEPEPTEPPVPAEDMDVDYESEQSWHGGDENDETKREGQSLLNMLYHIAEDQSRREGNVHRGVTCNGCSTFPIHGIRYRCTNCVDYDLCEQCEAMQIHPKTHLFMKIRIPTPSYSSTRRPQPVCYPGKSMHLPNNLSRDYIKAIMDESGFSDNEIEGLWDQFKTLAATEWPEDPDEFGMAIDRETFDRCFTVYTSTQRHPPASLVHDRLFAFYDTNSDGLVGFREFALGLATSKSKDPDERNKRVFRGYDYDSDGFISRRDCLMMCRALYAFQKDMTRDLLTDMEADLFEGGPLRDQITGNQPISSNYNASFGSPERHRGGEGKREDERGDLVIVDNIGAIAEDSAEEGDWSQIVGDIGEIAAFGALGANETNSARPDNTIDESDGDIQVDHAGLFSRNRSNTRSITLLEALRESTPEPPNTASTSEWPPEHVGDRDVERALGRPVAPQDVTSESDRKKILRVAANRIKAEKAEEERPMRQEARKAAIQERLDRRQFYLDDDNSTLDTRSLKSDQARPVAAQTESIQLNESLGHVSVAGTDEKALPTPSKSPQRAAEIRETTAQVYRQPPPLPKNVGQEILYQITQEAFNELVDPLFRLREEIAMEIIRLKPAYEMFNKHLTQFKTAPMIDLCKLQMKVYQSTCRKENVLHDDSSFCRSLLDVLRYQEDVHRSEYTRNLVDMFTVGMIDQPTLDRKFQERLVAQKSSGESRQEQRDLDGSTNAIDTIDHAEQQPSTAEMAGESQEYPAAALDLHEAVRAFNEGDTSLEENIASQSLDELLQQSGYGLIQSPPTSESSLQHLLDSTPLNDQPDPTLPQNRPNSLSAPSTPLSTTYSQHLSSSNTSSFSYPLDTTPSPDNFPPGASPSDYDIPATDTEWPPYFTRWMKYLTMIDTVRVEDEQRDGAGKISFEEYEEVIKGPRATTFNYLGSWLDNQTF